MIKWFKKNKINSIEVGIVKINNLKVRIAGVRGKEEFNDSK